MKTNVGKYKVQVKNANFLSIVTFTSGEHGKKERGDFAFWTAILKKRVNKKWKISGRAHLLLPPGDRFDRMKREARTDKNPEDRKIYHQLFHEYMGGGSNVKHIRPATEKDIKKFRLSPLRDLTNRIADIYGLGLFSTEIAVEKWRRFVVVDYINDQCDMRKKSKFVDAVCDEIVDAVVSELVTRLYSIT